MLLLINIHRPLERSSVRDILDLQSNPRSDDSGLETCSLDLLNPTIWYSYRDPARCGVDGDSMDIRWIFDGDSMEIPWRFDGDSMVFDGFSTVGHPRAQRPPARAWSLQDGPGSIRDTSGSRWTTPGNRKTLRGSLRALPDSLRTPSGGSGTSRKHRQTIQNDSKIIQIMKMLKMDPYGSVWTENPSI